jgi:hypothetical protein
LRKVFEFPANNPYTPPADVEGTSSDDSTDSTYQH